MKDVGEKYNLVKEIFDHQLRVTEHEDNKAGRIILSISFIATAASTIFSTFLNRKIEFLFFNIDIISISFLVVITSTIIGVSIILYGIGPDIKDSKNVKNEPVKKEPYFPVSVFYFVNICKEDSTAWREYLSNENIEIVKEKAVTDLINESHSIATRIDRKDRFIHRGKIFFYISLLFTAIMSVLGILFNL